MNFQDIRLVSQQLAKSTLQTPQDVVGWMGAIQSQDYNMAKWAIGIRLPGCTEQTIEEAFNKGEILRTHVMRPTWHFVIPENIRWMLDLTAPRLKSATKSNDRNLGLTNDIYKKCNQIIEKVLEGGKHLTREEIASKLNQAGIAIDNTQMYRIMFHAELDKIVCSGALQNKKHTYALLDERVPATMPLNQEEALVKLVHIYFSSHSPATLQDFSWWSGLSISDAKKGIEELKSLFIQETFNGQIYWMLESLASIENLPDSVHLLPAFDEYIISYKNRDAVIHSDHQEKAFSKNGIFYPVILFNGKAVGIWKKGTAKNKPTIFDFFDNNEPINKELLEISIQDCYSKFW